MKENIYIYYTNDLHSNFTYWPNVVAYLKQQRDQRNQRNESSFQVDIGDHIDRVHPVAEAFKGRGNVELLNQAGYDFVTIGNNEGITLAHDDLYHLYDNANFQVICSNLQSLSGKAPDWLHSSKIVTTKHGVRIGFLGLTAPFNPFYHLLKWHTEQPDVVLKNIVHRLAQSTDIIILLSHLGIHEDQKIAENFPEIDVIIGGHTHHLLKNEITVQQTTITAAGKHCTHVGEVLLTWDHDKNQLSKNKAYVTNITNFARDQETERLLQHLQTRAFKKLSVPIAFVEQKLSVNWYRETLIIRKLADTLLKWTGADCAMLNAGLLLDHLPPGKITYFDVHRVCPHPINPVVVELTGKELKGVVRSSQTTQFMDFELTGFGFRGKKIGKMVFSGLEIDTVNHHQMIKEIYVQNDKISDDDTYQVATADMFIFGRLLPEIAKAKKKDLFVPEFMRSLLVYTLKENFSRM